MPIKLLYGNNTTNCNFKIIWEATAGEKLKTGLGRIRDTALLDQFTQIDFLPENDKQLIKGLLDAFIKKSKFEILAHG